ncbi:MAG: divalent cation tolerance protein CutA [Candidatus Peribacteraceae bacterium]|jgi:hypothetical protein|nr:divalent cation tolerance protein CutA [Candidatus Peribacteraceae bacterium]HCI03310.1 hypothetical protein [Candidatus Peribacteria bacterium]|tara:strand:+ start:398 stop:733 length:336 start_codon:yes stop_codon:yes gene_type:complete
MQAELYHVIVLAPVDCADAVRKALADAGAGHIGNYDSCSFSSKVTGRFRPLEGSDPAIGSEGKLEEVEEERIEVVVTSEKLNEVLSAVKDVHPYDEPAIHVLPMIDYKKVF